MSAHAIVWWATLIALVAILALAGVQVARALREFKRVQARVEGFAELPVMKAVAKAETDMLRIEGISAHIDPLVARAQAAVAVIRKGPIPPELIAAAQRVRAEIVALRGFAAR